MAPRLSETHVCTHVHSPLRQVHARALTHMCLYTGTHFRSQTNSLAPGVRGVGEAPL